MRTPVAPTGWPPPMRPPDGFTGVAPSRSSVPSSTAFQLSPGAVMPKWSMAMYSDGVKQSWVSMPSMPDTSAMPGPCEGVGDRSAHVGHDVLVVGRALQLVGERQADGAMPPADDARHGVERPAARGCPCLGGAAAGEHEPGAAVGDLAAVGSADAALDDRVGDVVGGEALRRVRPCTGLRVGVVLRVAEVELGDGRQVAVVEAVAAVVLVGQQAEHVAATCSVASSPSWPIHAAAPRLRDA